MGGRVSDERSRRLWGLSFEDAPLTTRRVDCVPAGCGAPRPKGGWQEGRGWPAAPDSCGWSAGRAFDRGPTPARETGVQQTKTLGSTQAHLEANTGGEAAPGSTPHRKRNETPVFFARFTPIFSFRLSSTTLTSPLLFTPQCRPPSALAPSSPRRPARPRPRRPRRWPRCEARAERGERVEPHARAVTPARALNRLPAPARHCTRTVGATCAPAPEIAGCRAQKGVGRGHPLSDQKTRPNHKLTSPPSPSPRRPAPSSPPSCP